MTQHKRIKFDNLSVSNERLGNYHQIQSLHLAGVILCPNELCENVAILLTVIQL